MELGAYLDQDSHVKATQGKWDAQRDAANDLLHKATASSKKEDIEAFQAANNELTATSVLLDGHRERASREWKEQQQKEAAEQQSARADLIAANPLKGGGDARQAPRSILDVIASSPEIAGLPRATYGDSEVIKWDSPQARKPIQLHFGARQFDPRNALRGGMMAANEITTAAAPSPYQIQDITVPYALFDTGVLEVVNTFQMTNKSATYRRQSSLTRNEAPLGETSPTTKSTFAIELKTDTAHMIKGTFVVTEEELMSRADALPFVVAEANRDLRRTAAHQIFQGSDTGEDLNGIYNQATGSFIKGSSAPTLDNNDNAITTIDAIGYGYQDCRVVGACKPQLGFLHPNQFMPIRLLKNAIGDYIYGAPNLPMSDFYVLGVRFVEDIEAIDGTALLGDFNTYYSLGIFQGITVEIGMDGNDFGNWQRTIRFSFYGMNQVRRTSAFEKISNL
jgi:hypothetical protein